MQPKLSILICSIYERASMLASLLEELTRQIEENDALDKVEVLVEIDNKGERTTGEKRNALYQKANGIYSVSIDDDDWISNDYIEKIMQAAELGCDAIAISGWIETNGNEHCHWDISMSLPYETKIENGVKRYERWNNHISPIKSEICKRFLFTHKSYCEDYEWSLAIHEANAIKTERKVEGEIYFYKYNNKK